jgi:hypothetical protein
MDPVEAQLEAYNAHDLERFVVCYSEDVVVDDGKGNVLARGHAGLRVRYTPRFTEHPNLHCHIVHRARVGEFVVDHERITGWKDEDVGLVAVYRVVGDRIVHVSLLL